MPAEDLIYTEHGTYTPPHVPVKVSELTMKVEKVRREREWFIITAVDEYVKPVGLMPQPVRKPEKQHIEVNGGKASKEAREALKYLREHPHDARLIFDLYMTPTNYAMDALFILMPSGERVFIARTPLYYVGNIKKGGLRDE